MAMFRLCSRRQAAQTLVEFGLIVAALSLVGMAGLHVLGRAEESYFIPLGTSLAPQAPSGTDDVVHPTVVTISCTPTTVTLPGTASCTFTVTDNWQTRRSWPQGIVQLGVNGGAGGISCTLVQDTSSSDPARSTCPPVQWTPGIANIPSAILSAHYVPGDGTHAAPTSDPSQTIAVRVQVTAAFSAPAARTTPCWNPFAIFAGAPEKVEVGHPLICHLTVKDSLGQLYPSTPVTVSEVANPAGGLPFFSCFTSNNRSAYSHCDPAGPVFSGTTDTNGELTFVYRRYYDSLTVAVADTLTATATNYAGSSQAHVVTVAPATLRHSTETLVKCLSYVPAGAQATWTSRSGLVVRSDVQLNGPPAATVSCTALVFDNDPKYTTGNADTEDGYAPSGVVNLQDDVGHVYASCPLSPGNPVGPPYLAQQLSALPDYASACTLTFPIAGDHPLTVYYAGDTSGEHAASASQTIDADFH